eukprot:gene27825-35908_t
MKHTDILWTTSSATSEFLFNRVTDVEEMPTVGTTDDFDSTYYDGNGGSLDTTTHDKTVEAPDSTVRYTFVEALDSTIRHGVMEDITSNEDKVKDQLSDDIKMPVEVEKVIWLDDHDRPKELSAAAVACEDNFHVELRDDTGTTDHGEILYGLNSILEHEKFLREKVEFTFTQFVAGTIDIQSLREEYIYFAFELLSGHQQLVTLQALTEIIGLGVSREDVCCMFQEIGLPLEGFDYNQ